MISTFRDAMASNGIDLQAEIIPDGRFHRFRPNGSRNPDGWYVLHGDGIPAGSYGNWKTGESFTWCMKKQSELSPKERVEFRQRIEQQSRAREAEQARIYEQAARKAEWIWKTATPATEDHPYLKRKQVKAFGLRIAKDKRLIIPARNASGSIRTLQFIADDGEKRFLPGGRKAGHFFEIPGDTGTIYAGEGFATLATIHMAKGCQSVIAFDAGNLLPVARTIRQKYPKSEIIIAADNDAWTKGNPGVTKAEAAARAIKAKIAVPEFQDVSSRPTDWNDLHALEGIDMVKQQLQTPAGLIFVKRGDPESGKRIKVSFGNPKNDN